MSALATKRPAHRVLVVDDEPDLRELLCIELRAEGYSVQSASTALAAMNILTKEDFDLVLSDVRMPGMSGLEMLQEIRRREWDVEVILLTGYASVEDAIKGLRFGAVDFIRKPCQIDALLSSLKRALAQRRLQQIHRLHIASQTLLEPQCQDTLFRRLLKVSSLTMGAIGLTLFVADEEGEMRLVESEWSGLQPPQIAPGPPPEAPRSFLQGESSFCLQPLSRGEETLGAILLGYHRPPRHHDQELQEILSSYAALALQSIRLVGDLESKLGALERAQARLMRSERLATVGQVAAGITHEINNPTSYILLNLDLLREGLEDLRELSQSMEGQPFDETLRARWLEVGKVEVVDEFLQATAEAREGLERIRGIVSDVRGMSRAQSGAHQSTQADLVELAQSTVRIARASLHPQVQLDVDLPSRLELSLQPGRLSQVLLNLILNANHACVDRESARISVQARRTEAGALLSVRDQGCGITEEDRARIFDPFFTTRASSNGTGLGLSISNEIVKSHGGRLIVDSVEGLGSSFILELPMPTEEPSAPAGMGCVLASPELHERLTGDPQLPASLHFSEALDAWNALYREDCSWILAEVRPEGHMGLRLAMSLRKQRPERLRQLVLVCPPGLPAGIVRAVHGLGVRWCSPSIRPEDLRSCYLS